MVVRFNEGAIVALLKQPGGAVVRDLMRRGNAVLRQARMNAPVDQGNLRGSLTAELVYIGGDPAVRVGSNLSYAVYVHEGTGIYGKGAPIRPKSGKFLRWPAKNQSGRGARRYRGGKTIQYVFAREVKGMKGRPFLRDALPAGLT